MAKDVDYDRVRHVSTHREDRHSKSVIQVYDESDSPSVILVSLVASYGYFFNKARLPYVESNSKPDDLRWDSKRKPLKWGGGGCTY